RASLCGSSYDTEISIQDSLTGAVLACSDDFCGLASEGTTPVLAGHGYNIIVDGYGGAGGIYTLLVESCPGPPPPFTCPPSAMQEGEPDCYNGYFDNYDGGCNSSPEAYVDLQCSQDTTRICGTYGTYQSPFGQSRDTDWYRINFNDRTTLHYAVTGEYG